MKAFTKLLLFMMFTSTLIFAQPTRPVSRISSAGILETLGLEVKFKKPVINSPKGVRNLNVDDVGLEFPRVKGLLQRLTTKYGEFRIIKQVPRATWGDTLKPRITDGVLVSVHDMSQLFYLRFSNYIPVEEVVTEVQQLPEIEYVHPPVEVASLAGTPNDPLYSNQWNLSKIIADKAWDITYGSSDITVAIIESNGLPQRDHPDLVNKWDMSKGEQGAGGDDHATRVAGIIGAQTDNGIGIASLGRGLKMAKYFFSYQEPDQTFLVEAIDSAVAQGNKVINCSFLTVRFVKVPGSPCWVRQVTNYSTVSNAIGDAIALGVKVVGGFGNSKAWLIYRDPCTNEDLSDYFPFQPYPAGYNGVIAVAATGANDLWAEGQDLNDPLQVYNHGVRVDVAAPGMNVLTTSASSSYNSQESGTSFSTPHVSALVGLILSLNPSLSNVQIKQIITATADKVGQYSYNQNGWNQYMGYGRINAYKALKYTLENYGGTLTQNLIIPSGETWNFTPGVTVKFSAGTSITVNGTLDAYGTSAAPITFTSSSPSTTWSGIYFASGSIGHFEYTNVNSVNSFGGAAITANNANYVSIKFSTIQNNTGACNGIAFLSNSMGWLHHNTINNNTHHGVYLFQSSPTLTQNNIAANSATGNAAIVCAQSSNPIFGDLYNTIPGKNTLTGGYYGLYVSSMSNPLLGSSTYPNFNNRIFGNSYADAYAENSSTVYAQYVWWGQSPPNTSKIIATSGSIIYYNPWLTSDPGQAFQASPTPPDQFLLPSLAAQQTEQIAVDTRELLLQARELRLKNEHARAVGLYKSILATASTSDEAKIALVEMGNVYRETKDQTLLQFIELFAVKSHPFRAVALELLANSYSLDKKLSDAEAMNNLLIAGFAGTVHEKHGRLNQFFLYLNSRQHTRATDQLAMLRTNFSNDEAVLLADWLLARETESVTSSAQQQFSVTTRKEIPLEFDLGNYPNPFNPSTNIRFALPSDGKVSLRVFDLLGREIQTLVNDFMMAGVHEVNFNAGQFPSGVYFYRLDAEGKTTIKKMLLTR